TAGPTNQAPTVSGPTSFSLAANQTISGSVFFQQNGFSWSDSDGSVTTLRLHDAIAGQGFFMYAGTNESGVSSFDVPVSNLSQLSYVTGSVAGSNSFSIEVIDNGGKVGNELITTANVTAGPTNQAPTVSGPTSFSLAANQTISGSVFFQQ